MEQLVLWLKFVVAAGVVVLAGLKLTRNAERLAEAMGWGHAFAGFVILGWATSLPEVTISLSAVEAVGSAGLAAGNITGSVIFNLAILALLDLLSLRRLATEDHDGAGTLALGLFNIAMLGSMLLLTVRPDVLPEAWSHISGVLLLGLYLLSALYCWWGERGRKASGEGRPPGARAAAAACLLAGACILAAGIWLSHIGDELASVYALDEGFVGTLFLASVSSLPELVTGVAAVRLGLLTMAAASILGSNIFNMGILGVCDLTYQAGDPAPTPILVAAAVDGGRMAGNLGAGLLLTLLALGTLSLRRRGHGALPVGALATAMLLVYLAALAQR